MPYIGNIVQDFSVNTAMLNSDSVTSIKIDDGTIVNADINDSAAIAGTKISPDFGSQAIATTGSATIGTDLIHAGDTDTKLSFGTDTISVATNGVTRMTFTGNFIDLPDAGTLRLGNSNDFKISHGSGGASNIEHSNTSQPLKISATGAGNIALLTNSNERMRIDSSGNVGIGTTSPAVKLHLSGTSGLYTRFQNTSAGNNVNFGQSAGDGIIDVGGSFGLRILTNSTDRIKVDSSGNVGIGTTSPGKPLDVAGELRANAFIGRTNISAPSEDTSVYRAADNTLAFGTASTERMRIDSSGRLLIGATSAANNERVRIQGRTVDGSSTTIDLDGTGTSGPLLEMRSSSSDSNQLAVLVLNQASLKSAIAASRPNSGNWGTDLRFYTHKDATSNQHQSYERMRIDSAGRVQIGVTSANDTATALTIKNAASASEHTILEIICDDNETSRVTFSEASTLNNGSIRYNFTGDTRAMQFYTNGNNERMRIDSSGRVGIGTTSPVNPLHVVLAGTDVATFESTDAGSSGSQVSFKHTSASPADNDTIANLTFDGRDDGNNATTYAQLRVLATDVSNGSESGDIQFFTRGAGTFAERFRIRNTGNISIQTNDVGFSGAGTLRINSGSTAGALNLDGGATNHGGEINLLGGSNGGRIIFRTGVGSGQQSEKMRLNENGLLMMGNTGSLDMGFGPQVLSIRAGNSVGYDGTAAAIFGQLDNDAATCIFYNASSTNGTNMLDTRCARTNNSAYSFHIMRSNSASDTEFRWRGDGDAFADGSFSGGGADYAEYFEWSDGNTSDEDRRGYTVVLDGNKIRKSTSSDTTATIIGVVSGNPSVVGDTDLDKWKQKYKRDDYGTYLRDSNGERVLNPTWDESIEYVSREKRKEWSIIGLMGKIRIRKGQTMGTNWIKMRDISDSVEEWLVR